MLTTATFIPPCLCGCEFNITAEWTEELPDGVSYRHPKPFTIQKIEATNICDDHKGLSRVIDESWYFDQAGNQYRGYLKYPILKPTKAEILYSHLYRYTANNHHPDTCECVIATVIDRVTHERKGNGSPTTILHHEKHSRYCKHHMDDHEGAALDNQRKNKALASIKSAHPELDVDAVYDDQRNLIIVSNVPIANPDKLAAFDKAQKIADDIKINVVNLADITSRRKVKNG